MIRQGAIVLIPFPFTDLSTNKVRPALILALGHSGEDVVVAFISSQQKKKKYTVAVTPSDRNGLRIDSMIVCDKLATLEKTIVLGELGFLEEETIALVRSKLKVLFGL
jgi:mRNA interferase MazF